MKKLQKRYIPDALSPQTTQSSRTPPEASFMPERLRREVVSFIPERLSAPPRSKLSAMLIWWVDIVVCEVLVKLILIVTLVVIGNQTKTFLHRIL